MIADQVVGGARDSYPGVQEAHLQCAKVFLAAAIHVSDERSYLDASCGGRFELRLNVGAVKSKNRDIDRFFGFFDGGEKRSGAIARLINQLHRQEIQNDETRTFTLISLFVGIS